MLTERIKKPSKQDTSREDGSGHPSVVVLPAPTRHQTHKERFRASMAWALDEWSNTLEKLAK